MICFKHYIDSCNKIIQFLFKLFTTFSCRYKFKINKSSEVKKT